MSNHIANIAVYVADLERSERFYTEVLGLSVTARIAAPTVDEVIVAGETGSSLMLARAKDDIPTGPPSGIWKIFVQTDDVHDLYDRAMAAGATSVMVPTRLEQFRVTIAMVTDPDGYIVELGHVEPRP